HDCSWNKMGRLRVSSESYYCGLKFSVLWVVWWRKQKPPQKLKKTELRNAQHATRAGRPEWLLFSRHPRF
ncbi:MAG: hypothetical protein ACK5AN_18755, partial [Planctomyces sp.]